MTGRPVGTAAEPRRRSFAYPVILVLGALDAAGYSVIAPTSPAIAEATGVGPATIGALVASFPVGIAIGFPLAGRLVTRRGATSVLLPSLFLLALGSLGFVLGTSLPAYFASRLLMGLGSGGLWIGVTFETLQRWPGQEYLCMSRVFAAYSVGGLAGPALGVIGGVRGPFAAYLVAVVAAAGLVRLMEPPGRERAFHPDRTALRLPGFGVAAGGILFAVLGLGVVEGVLPLHLASGLGQRQIAVTFVALSAVVAVAAGGASRFRPGPMLASSVVLVAAGLAVAGAGNDPVVSIPALLVAGVGIGIGNTGSIGVLLEAVPAERIVTAMVVWSQLGIGGYLIGPLAGGLVAERLGFGAVGVVPVVAGLALAAVAAAARRSAARA